MHEDLLVGLCSALNECRLSAFDQIIRTLASEEPEAGEVDQMPHLWLNKLAFLSSDRHAAMRQKIVESWSYLEIVQFQSDFHVILSALLEDESEIVRESCMRYIMFLTTKMPSLLDYTFVRMCERVNDISIPNRSLACEMLGELHGAPMKLLRLSLDKQSGQDSDWCAAGAFVIALEDQFMDVRLAAISSLSKICLARPEFAIGAKALIIDAFNDETHEVRQLAIETLKSVCEKTPLEFDITHIESILCLLDDASASLRHATRLLLHVFNFPDAESILRAVRCLYAAAKKFPGDMDGICACLAAMGANMPDLVFATLPVLLKLDRFYMMAEPRVEDLNYELRMIMIYNAAYAKASLADELPTSAYKHFSYFHLRFGKFTPSFRNHSRSHLFYNTSSSATIT